MVGNGIWKPGSGHTGHSYFPQATPGLSPRAQDRSSASLLCWGPVLGPGPSSPAFTGECSTCRVQGMQPSGLCSCQYTVPSDLLVRADEKADEDKRFRRVWYMCILAVNNLFRNCILCFFCAFKDKAEKLEGPLALPCSVSQGTLPAAGVPWSPGLPWRVRLTWCSEAGLLG